jgi:hypothetical protein
MLAIPLAVGCGDDGGDDKSDDDFESTEDGWGGGSDGGGGTGDGGSSDDGGAGPGGSDDGGSDDGGSDDDDADDTGEPPPACEGLIYSVEMHNPDTACTECDSSEPFTTVGIVHNPCDDAITLEHFGGIEGSMFESVALWTTSASDSTGHGGDCEGAGASTEIAAGASIETRYEWGLLSDQGDFPTEGEFEVRVNFCTADLPSERPGASATFTSVWPPD